MPPRDNIIKINTVTDSSACCCSWLPWIQPCATEMNWLKAATLSRIISFPTNHRTNVSLVRALRNNAQKRFPIWRLCRQDDIVCLFLPELFTVENKSVLWSGNALVSQLWPSPSHTHSLVFWFSCHILTLLSFQIQPLHPYSNPRSTISHHLTCPAYLLTCSHFPSSAL